MDSGPGNKEGPHFWSWGLRECLFEGLLREKFVKYQQRSYAWSMSGNCTSRCLSRKNFSLQMHKKPRVQMAIETFIIANFKGKRQKYLSGVERINRQWFIGKPQCSTAVKMNEL